MTPLQNPYVIAQAIRALDSHLLSIELKAEAGQQSLIYCFEIAGHDELFSVPLTGASVDSISALYPSAQVFEVALQQNHGIVFRPWLSEAAGTQSE